MAGVQHHTGQRQSNSHIMALLSLKVLLLAFFILLNALSSFEVERSTAVLDSVREAFRGVVPAQQSVSIGAAGLGVMDGSDDVVEALGRLFDETLPIVESNDSANNRILQIDMPIADFFADGSAVIDGEALDTLAAIAVVLSDNRFAGEDYRVDLLYGLAGGSSDSQGRLLALRRAGALVTALEREALPPARLSTGLLPSFADSIRIHFTLPPARDGGAADSSGGE
ncbi:hypothetical protein HBA54_12665 [Pelagibius litoralis]|uniref:Motility protein B-like N-terminal domain-containing protein n=1 Tax=Pelagibius litoralis TaxID=374515 RepID=A0A967EXY2_9PROT|nr:hypothetical protein [Pelagibius litoralis]NIA69445.1 hypothetical protein [Pelagibius litoralis]